MSKIRILLLGMNLALGVAQAQQAPVEKARPAEVEIEAGGETRQVDGEKSFGMQRNRDVPQGAFLRRFDVRLYREGRPYFFTLTTTDLAQHDQRVTATFENVGRYKTTFQLWELPRYWSNRNTFGLNEVSRGRFVAPSALRAQFEGAADTELPGLALGLVAASPRIQIRSFRNRALVTQVFTPREGLEITLDFQRESRSGHRLFSSGTYNRIRTPAGDTFETPGQELPEPLAYATTEAGVGVQYGRQDNGKGWMVGAQYRASLFHNDQPSLIWQNVFRASDMQATQPDGALLRGRFASTQVSLPPSNQAHTIAGNGLVLLPYSTRLSALISWSRWTQDEAFLPWTINTAITAPNLPAESSPTNVASLPARSLDGRIQVLTQDYGVSSRPLARLQLNARYHDYDLSNETHEIRFPGYAAFGDSFWRTSIPPLPVQSEPKSFHRKTAQVEAAVKVAEPVNWKLGYRWDKWTRERRQVEDSTEHGLLTSLHYAPNNAFFVKGGYRYYTRRPDAYDPGVLEFALLRMFDQARRIRQQTDLLTTLQLQSRVYLSGNLHYSADNYDKTFFGLRQFRTGSGAVDLTFTPSSSVSLYAGVSRERTGYDYATIAKSGAPWDLRNSWNRDTRDRITSANFGLSASFAESRGSLDFGYSAALARTRINTANPFSVDPATATSATAHPFPEVKSQFHEFRLNASYKLSSKYTVGLYYLFEPYRLRDFANDSISPYPGDSLAPEVDLRRFFFLETGPSNYTGHMVALYLRYGF